MDWGLAKVLDQGGLADEGRSQRGRRRVRRRPDDAHGLGRGRVAGRLGAGDARLHAARAGPRRAWRRSTSGPTSSAWARSSARSSPASRPTPAASSVELYRKAERADLAGAIERLDACGADAELVALARSCLAAAPKDRPRDAGVVAAGLAAHLAGVEQRLLSAGLAQGAGRGPRRRGAEAADPGRRAGRDRAGRGDSRPRRAGRGSRATAPRGRRRPSPRSTAP